MGLDVVLLFLAKPNKPEKDILFHMLIISQLTTRYRLLLLMVHYSTHLIINHQEEIIMKQYNEIINYTLILKVPPTPLENPIGEEYGHSYLLCRIGNGFSIGSTSIKKVGREQ
jgi:hypothetical protein